MMHTQHADGCSSSTSTDSKNNVEDDRMVAILLSEEYTGGDATAGWSLSNLSAIAVSHCSSLRFDLCPNKTKVEF